jgi:hypothetical protein
LNKKRERNSSSEETDVVYKPEKKSKTESKKDKDKDNSKDKDKEKDKEKEKSTNDEISVENFIASLNSKVEKTNEKEKLKGENLIFSFRRKKAVEIINSITKEEKEKLKLIEKALSYDNTNKYCIYRLLKYYHDKNDKDKFEEMVKKYKYCITQKFEVTEGENEVFIDLNELYDISDQVEEQEELPNRGVEEDNISDLRNILVDVFTNYYYIAENISRKIRILSEKDLKSLLTIKFKPSEDNDEIEEILYNNEKKQKIFDKYKDEEITADDTNELLTFIENFLSKYLPLQNLSKFENNQPISYKNNLTLYFNYIMYLLFDATIIVDEKEEQIYIKKDKLLTYVSLKDVHDIVFDKFFDSKDPIGETINHLLQYLLISLNPKGGKFLYFIADYIHTKKTEKFLDHSTADKLITNLNEKFGLIKATVEKDKLYIEENKKLSKLEIKYKNYSTIVAGEKADNKFEWLYTAVKFETFQNNNFFLEADINYLKYLIKHILSSNLFKQIYDNYSNVNQVVDFYFKEEKNIDDYIDRIVFLPFKAKDINRFSKTDKGQLSVLVSAFPEHDITFINQYRINRLLELSLRVVILALYEPANFIGNACSILTKGKVNKIEKSNIHLMEEILFGWSDNEEDTLDINSKFNIDKNCKENNEAIKNRQIDLITALKLLEPDIYDKDLNFFRKNIFEATKEDLKTFSFSDLDEEYKNYLESVMSENMIKNSWKNDIYINASGFDE